MKIQKSKVRFKNREFQRLFIEGNEFKPIQTDEYVVLQFRKVPFETTVQLIAYLVPRTKVLGVYVGKDKTYFIAHSNDEQFKVGEKLRYKVSTGGQLTTHPPKAPHLILKRNKKIFYLSFSSNEAMKKAWHRAWKSNGLLKYNGLHYTVVDGVEWG